METQLKTYPSEERFAADRAPMEAKGWSVKKWQYREAGGFVGFHDASTDNPPYVRQDGRVSLPNPLAWGMYLESPERLADMAGSGRRALQFLVAVVLAPFAWIWAKVRSGERIDVLYERP